MLAPKIARRIALGFVLLVVSARLAAPYFVRDYVVKQIRAMDGYTGDVKDVELHLWRGAYEVQDIAILKTGGKAPVPFLSIEHLDLGLAWKSLLDGALVANVALFRPQVNFTNGKSAAQKQTGAEADWQTTLENIVPLRVDRFVVVDGEVHYRDFSSSPRVDVYIDHLNIKVENLTNSKKISKNRVARIEATANLMHGGALKLDGDIDPFTKQPTFRVRTRLSRFDLKQINPFLKAYLDVDVERGTLGLYSELAARNGKFTGYAKPLIDDLDVLDWKNETERPIERLWEGLVGGAAVLVTNWPHDRVATRIPIEGSFKDPAIGTWSAVGSLLRNAFIRVLRAGLDKPKS